MIQIVEAAGRDLCLRMGQALLKRGGHRLHSRNQFTVGQLCRVVFESDAVGVDLAASIERVDGEHVRFLTLGNREDNIISMSYRRSRFA